MTAPLVPGPVVLLDERVCAALEPVLTVVLREIARRDGLALTAEVRAAVEAVQAVARAARARAAARLADAAASGRGTAELPQDVASASVLDVWSAARAAQALGCSDRNVRALASAGRLPGTRGPAGEWLFDPVEVDAYRRRRAVEKESA